MKRLHNIVTPLLLGTMLLSLPLHAAFDRDGDGLSDIWTAKFPAATTPDADNDSDGVPNREEAAAGTDPTDATSRFTSTVTYAADTVALRWRGEPGKHYRLETSDDLSRWTPTPARFVGAGADLTTVAPQADPAGGGRKFWRVVAFDADTDGDGLSDWEEAALGTSPTSPDTDGDGDRDGSEVGQFTDPLHAPTFAHTYYLDASSGSDTNDGSQAHPWQTFKHALANVAAGDRVLMNSGNYGTLIAGRTKDEDKNWGDYALPRNEFTNWVTFQAAPGQEPHVTSLDFGTRNTAERNASGFAVKLPFAAKGHVDIFMRFEGLHIDDGVQLKACRHVQVVNCRVRRQGDIIRTGIDDHWGFEILGCRFVTLRGNEITPVSVGIQAAAFDLEILDNHIHHNSHDGIRIWGGENWLIEGNRIHDLDDGVDDVDQTNGCSWNRHVDGIQIWTHFDVTSNVTLRGNLFYHLESMGIMFASSTIAGRNFSNWTIENNVFGPVGGNLNHFGTTITRRFIYRHNTIVHAPNDIWTSIYPTNQWTGAPRTMNLQKYNFSWWPSCPDEGYIYNNIIADNSRPRTYSNSPRSFTGFNLLRLAPSSGGALNPGEFVAATLPYEEIPGNIQDYIDTTGHWPGRLKADSIAADAGTRLHYDLETPLDNPLEADFSGTARDARPDLGAFELPGRSPAPESFPGVAEPAAPVHFVDDFSDGRLDLRDRLLNGADSTGLQWKEPAGFAHFHTGIRSGTNNCISSSGFDPGLAVSTKRFRNLTFEADFYSRYSGCGVALLYQDTENYTYIDFGAGTLVRKQDGVDTTLATFTFPSGSAGHVTIGVSSSGAEVTVAMQVKFGTAAPTTLFTHTAAAPFQTGAFGFYRNRTIGNSWDRIDFDNVRIDLPGAADLVGDL